MFCSNRCVAKLCRVGLTGFSLIGVSCLEVGVLDPSILKTERPPRLSSAPQLVTAPAATHSILRAAPLPRERVRSLAQSRSSSASASTASFGG
jgi:hypothetical protein